MKNKIENIELHDAYFTDIEFHTKADYFDEIVFVFKIKKKPLKFVFKNCFCANINLNMWISGKESIRDCCHTISADYNNKITDLKKRGYLPKEIEFKYFKITTNTSNSIVELAYEDVDVLQ